MSPFVLSLIHICGEVGGDVIVDVHLADGDRAEDKGGQKDQIEGLPLIYNEARQLEMCIRDSPWVTSVRSVMVISGSLPRS